MSVSIINQQNILKIQAPALRKLLQFFLMKSANRTGIRWGEVSVVLVDDSGSRDVNEAYLGHAYATDVISFNLDPVPGEADPGLCGEIIVNVEEARQKGCLYGGANHELALYIAHGCDHLSGEDDQTPSQRQRMRRRELRWLKEARAKGLMK